MKDHDLLMLENLTYLDDNVSGIDFYNEKGEKISYKTLEQCDNVKQFLEQFGSNELYELDNGNLEQQEWAARIRYMQANDDICSLKIIENNPENKCLLFEDPNDSNRCIVAFKGTTGDDEWIDNIEGLNRSDTNAQKNAKKYVDNLNYDKVTVIGHSKGGNKAMYVAVTSDKVDKCISYDGQGFSQEFIDKYSVEIHKNAHKIKNYSLKNDYVHILMFPIPGAEQIYMEPGNRVDKIGGAHYPIGLFTLKQKNGKWYVDDSNGVIKISSNEDPAMSILHNFTTFFMNNASKSDRDLIVAFLSPLIPLIMNKNMADKEKMDAIAEYLTQNREGAIKIVAYLLKYFNANGMGVEELVQICESIGISRDELFRMVCKFVNVPDDIVKKIAKIMNISEDEARVFIGDVISKYAFGQITDGKEDKITHFIIGLLAKDTATDIKSWWTSIESEYNDIKVVAGSENYQSLVRNYSIERYNQIMYVISSFENNSFPEVSSWNQYSCESWFSKLLIPSVIKCINGYKNKLSSINSECRTRVNSTFNNIESVDSKYGKKLDSVVSGAKTLKYQIQE